MTIRLGDRSIEYRVRESSRSRNFRISIFPGGELVVTAPRGYEHPRVEQFMHTHKQWILKTIARLEKIPVRTRLASGKRAYARDKTLAKKLVIERLRHFNAQYKFKIESLSIRNQKSRWGSCSRKGHLSFNFKVAHLPSELLDYIVVHELCHLEEMNHSRAFWTLVAQAIPQYQKYRKELRGYSLR